MACFVPCPVLGAGDKVGNQIIFPPEVHTQSLKIQSEQALNSTDQ